MAHNVFSIPIFFIVFRETLEAAIIISVLLGLVEQIVHLRSDRSEVTVQQTTSPSPEDDNKKESGDSSTRELGGEDDALRSRSLIRKMRFQECPILPIPRTSLILDTLGRLDLSWVRRWFLHCCRNWRDVYCHLVHQGFEPL
jgi:hypothetical protein